MSSRQGRASIPSIQLRTDADLVRVRHLPEDHSPKHVYYAPPVIHSPTFAGSVGPGNGWYALYQSGLAAGSTFGSFVESNTSSQSFQANVDQIIIPRQKLKSIFQPEANQWIPGWLNVQYPLAQPPAHSPVAHSPARCAAHYPMMSSSFVGGHGNGMPNGHANGHMYDGSGVLDDMHSAKDMGDMHSTNMGLRGGLHSRRSEKNIVRRMKEVDAEEALKLEGQKVMAETYFLGSVTVAVMILLITAMSNTAMEQIHVKVPRMAVTYRASMPANFQLNLGMRGYWIKAVNADGRDVHPHRWVKPASWDSPCCEVESAYTDAMKTFERARSLGFHEDILVALQAFMPPFSWGDRFDNAGIFTEWCTIVALGFSFMAFLFWMLHSWKAGAITSVLCSIWCMLASVSWSVSSPSDFFLDVGGVSHMAVHGGSFWCLVAACVVSGLQTLFGLAVWQFFHFRNGNLAKSIYKEGLENLLTRQGRKYHEYKIQDWAKNTAKYTFLLSFGGNQPDKEISFGNSKIAVWNNQWTVNDTVAEAGGVGMPFSRWERYE